MDQHEQYLNYYAELLTPISIARTGSRALGCASPDSDYDLLILADPNKSLPDLEEFLPCSGTVYDEESFIILRNPENVNLIITTNTSKFYLWLACDRVARNLKLDKNQRAVLYSSIVDNR